MKCEICQEDQATVHFKQVYGGKVKELHVCEDCASEHGLDLQSPVSMTDFLFGLGAQKPGKDKNCPACHMRHGDFRKTSRLGCPVCYETFSEELAPLMSAMHVGACHAGKAPLRERVSAEVTQLRTSLEKAIQSQNFEEAARLRDRIQDLDAGEKPVVPEKERPERDR